MTKATARDTREAVQIFFLDKMPQGLDLLPIASRQCADTPSARKYKTHIATSLSTEKLFANEPQAANETTIPVYGKKRIPQQSLKFLGPNLGTNHSENLSFCTIS